MLWLLTSSWLAASCGRLGFDEHGGGTGNELPDASLQGAPPNAPPAGPAIKVARMPAITSACGAMPAQFAIMLENPGDQPLIIASVVVGATMAGSAATAATGTGPAAGDAFSVPATFPLTIAPGATASLPVIPPRAVVGTDRANTFKSAQLTLNTNLQGPDKAALETLMVSSKVTGINLDVAVGGGGTSLAFSGTAGQCPVTTKSVQVTNSGTKPVALDGLTASGVAIASGFSGGILAAGASATTVFRASTSGDCATSGILTYAPGSSTNEVCTAPVVLNVSLTITGASSSCFCS